MSVSCLAAATLFAWPGVSTAQRPVSSAFQPVGVTDSVTSVVPDSFTGPDKPKHFLMSGFIESFGFGVLQAINVDRSVSIGAATTATLAIGLAREIHDKRTKGLFSIGDLTWDALGTTAALLMISHTQRH